MKNTPILVNEIIPKPKTVLEFYEGHPERWTQDPHGRVNRDGMPVADRKYACALCLGAAMGHVYLRDDFGVYGLTHQPAFDAAEQRLFRMLYRHEVARMGFEEAWEARLGQPWIPVWNDFKGRTFDDIVQVCKEARI